MEYFHSALQKIIYEIIHLVGTYGPRFAGALVILVIGWSIAWVISGIVRRTLRRTELDNRLVCWVAGEEAAKTFEVERLIAKVVYYLIILFVLVAFFQTLGLTVITEPLNQLLILVFQYIPRILGAAFLLLIAWIVASLSRLIVLRVLSASKIDKRLMTRVGFEESKDVSLAQTVSNGVYWVILLLFLPALLDILALQGLLQPVQGMIHKILGFLPNILAASFILLAGWIVARIVQRLVVNLLSTLGVDRFGEKVGLAQVLGKQQLSGLLGFVVYILILLPVLVAALDALSLEGITTPASNMLNAILMALPNIFAACLLMTIAYAVGRLVSGLVTNLLTIIGFNTILERLGLRKETVQGKYTPSEVVGYLVIVAVILFAAIEAFRLLGFVLLADLVARFMIFIGRITSGFIVFGIGLYLSNLAFQAIQVSNIPQAKLLALAARLSILILAGAMALNQMGLAGEIISLAFGLLLGAIAVAVALAFGLGGREIASRVLENWLESIKSRKS